MKQEMINGLTKEEYFKAYREANKDKIKAYYEANKDKIAEHFRNTHITIPSLGARGTRNIIYTNGVTKEIKEQLPKIINDVLDDCIKNTRKYLDESGGNSRLIAVKKH